MNQEEIWIFSNDIITIFIVNVEFLMEMNGKMVVHDEINNIILLVCNLNNIL